jgi:hypothetical protein
MESITLIDPVLSGKRAEPPGVAEGPGLSTDDSPYFCECDGLYGTAPGDQGDGVAMNAGLSRHFPNPHSDNPFSHFFVGNHPAVTVFRAPEIHHADVVALLPTS